ncbi:MAG TPA: ABC transporter ATP-binding protein [Rhodocyclaceae bacterium]|nr:ABC transporter ATP-binding protein [Rhodocyclaceae bacterium]
MNGQIDAAIAVGGLSRRFGTLTALDRLSFSVAPGEIFGLVGPDGAGKTTAMRLCAGVMRPDEGSIVIDGVDVLAHPERAKRHVSYMPQRFALYEDLTVEENIRFFADLFEMPSELWRARAEAMLAASDMTRFKGRLAGQLSGGMKQKLGLTCSLVHAPRVLLLDEPTTGVDPISRREFWQILYGLRAEGVAMLISTAYLDEAERCDRLALLHRGKMMYCDTPAGLKARMPGAMIEVLSPEPRRVRELAQTLPGVRSVLLVGNGAHIHADDAGLLPQLAAALAASGIAVTGVKAVAPTIEDLFVALLDQQPEAA